MTCQSGAPTALFYVLAGSVDAELDAVGNLLTERSEGALAGELPGHADGGAVPLICAVSGNDRPCWGGRADLNAASHLEEPSLQQELPKQPDVAGDHPGQVVAFDVRIGRASCRERV